MAEEANVMFQYTVRDDWEQKVKDTLKRLLQEFPNSNVVIFCTNQLIGAKGDRVRKLAREQGVSLDIRDRSWFVERLDLDDSRKNAAAELARVIVDPLLEQAGVIESTPGLRGQEAKTALVFLELQAKDENVEKGLTKSCYESLVKAALQGTSSSSRLSRQDIYTRISALLPQHDVSQLAPFVDAALKRLDKSAVKYYPREDEFHVSYEEVERTKDRIAGLALLQESFRADVHDIVRTILQDDTEKIAQAQNLIREIIETYFYRLGEEFAQSVAGNVEIPLHVDTLKNIALECSPTGRVSGKLAWADFLYSTVASLIASPSVGTTELFRVLSTAYTLFAFLSEVPDVQRATKKLFEHGNLWFDTTVLLPLIAEQAFPDDMRPFTDLVSQLRKTGLKLWVTRGVIEEIERHLNLCKAYLRIERWVGRVPYVYQRYALSGGHASRFEGWLERFVGNHRPLDDLADFLADTAAIEVTEIPSMDKLPATVVSDVRDYWHAVQDKRRGSGENGSHHSFRLAEHDTENYLSVLAQRRIEPGKSIMGYTSWLVTMDSAAWRLMERVDAETSNFIEHSPIISLDFLLRFLSFGPRRDQIDVSKKGYSRIFGSTIYESVSPELIAVAQQVRENCHGLSERIVQRRIRDEFDRQRMSAGTVQTAGLDGLDQAIASMY
ncbi:hypothetical protein G6L45_33445 [Agrobacterium rhizogenes]|nr:hypothetical protein [Rhizobium rhizogenes]NTG84500.1 hypothetical protein [Rhizobium rhizogenes]NTI00360.1 hypothetical protein [Rhizobium rhizogenes]NTJ18588.1 hypothetical protein [Rhizobium rhizogenes]